MYACHSEGLVLERCVGMKAAALGYKPCNKRSSAVTVAVQQHRPNRRPGCMKFQMSQLSGAAAGPFTGCLQGRQACGNVITDQVWLLSNISCSKGFVFILYISTNYLSKAGSALG